MQRRFATVLALSLTAFTAFAQNDAAAKKPASPPAKTELTIAGKNISIDYAAPSKRGRKIMGGLVPYGEVWRTGANAATTLKTDGALRIGNLNVPAGTYTLYTIPTAKNWTLIVSRQTGQWGSSYDEKQDLGRVPMTVRATSKPVETFAIALTRAAAKKANLTLSWENVAASVPITVE